MSAPATRPQPIVWIRMPDEGDQLPFGIFATTMPLPPAPDKCIPICMTVKMARPRQLRMTWYNNASITLIAALKANPV
jgi:hypothetical protein